jgi:hypothetical protein
MKNTIFFIIYLFHLGFHEARGQGQVFQQSIAYYTSSQLVRWTYPEESLRLLEYLIEAYSEKFCSKNASYSGSSSRINYENLSKLGTAIEKNFYYLTDDILTDGKLSPGPLYKKILFRIYPTVNAYSNDKSEQNRLEEQNDRYSKILYGHQLLLEKVLPEHYSESSFFGIHPQLMWQIKQSFILTILESVKVQIISRSSVATRSESVCFPWDHQYSLSTSQMLNYLESMLQANDTQYSAMSVCDEFASMLEVLIYSQLSSLSTTNISGQFLGTPRGASYCPNEPFIDKLLSL